MIEREATSTLRSRLQRYPVVALVGPRQCGKTTLARSFNCAYYDLEQDSEQLRLDVEWPQLVNSSQLIVLDEAQSMPEVFPRIRGAVDEDRKRNGRILLLGSVSPALMEHVSESLAGRLSVVELTPFIFTEVSTRERARHWLCGGFPDGGVLDDDSYPQWQLDYLTLLAQRDLPNWGLPSTPQMTQRLFRMTASLSGQVWNASEIGKSLGIAYHTVNRYVDYLEGAYLVTRLQPFHANVLKRLVKRPKLYWRDSGLLHTLLRTNNQAVLYDQPWVGASWEGYVIEQISNLMKAHSIPFEAFYFRTSDQYEIDLVIQTGQETWAIEIKLTSNPSSSDQNRLHEIAEWIDADLCFLISTKPSFLQNRQHIVSDLGGVLRYVCNRAEELGGNRT